MSSENSRETPLHPAAGPLMALLAFALYAVHDVAVKYLGATFSVFQIVFFAGLLTFPLVSIVLLQDPTTGTLRARHPWWSLLRTLGVMGSAAGAFHAFSVLPLAQTYAILFATPLVITLLSIPLLGEKVGIRRGAAVVVGLVGVLIVLRPGTTALSSGHLAALGAALCSATAAVVVRRIGRHERSAVLILWPMVLQFIVMGAVMPWVYVPVGLVDLALMGAVAALGFLAMLLTIAAYRHSEAALVAPMQYSQILWAVLFGALLFDELPDMWTAVGAAVIIASGLYIVLRESRADVSANRPVQQTTPRVGSVSPQRPLDADEPANDSLPLAKLQAAG